MIVNVMYPTVGAILLTMMIDTCNAIDDDGSINSSLIFLLHGLGVITYTNTRKHI